MLVKGVPWLEMYEAIRRTGPRFNIKMSSYQYRESHCGDKTVVRSSYLHNGISYTGKMSSLYWIGAQVLTHSPLEDVAVIRSIIFKPILGIETLSTRCKIYISWMPQSPIDKRSKLVEVMAWCQEICRVASLDQNGLIPTMKIKHLWW